MAGADIDPDSDPVDVGRSATVGEPTATPISMSVALGVGGETDSALARRTIPDIDGGSERHVGPAAVFEVAEGGEEVLQKAAAPVTVSFEGARKLRAEEAAEKRREVVCGLVWGLGTFGVWAYCDWITTGSWRESLRDGGVLLGVMVGGAAWWGQGRARRQRRGDSSEERGSFAGSGIDPCSDPVDIGRSAAPGEPAAGSIAVPVALGLGGDEKKKSEPAPWKQGVVLGVMGAWFGGKLGWEWGGWGSRSLWVGVLFGALVGGCAGFGKAISRRRRGTLGLKSD